MLLETTTRPFGMRADRPAVFLQRCGTNTIPKGISTAFTMKFISYQRSASVVLGKKKSIVVAVHSEGKQLLGCKGPRRPPAQATDASYYS